VKHVAALLLVIQHQLWWSFSIIDVATALEINKLFCEVNRS
jgi:hypothetical protein